MRNTKTELDDLGEAMTSAQYDKLVQALTKYNVALVDQNGEYRATYDIMADIAAQWDNMTSMEQSALATLASGTRQQSIFFSIVEQFQEASGAMDAMSNSTGELKSSYEIYMESVSAHIQQLKASFQGLSADVFESDFIIGLVDFAGVLVNIIDKVFDLINVLGGLKSVLVPLGVVLVSTNFNRITASLGNLMTNVQYLGLVFKDYLVRNMQLLAGPIVSSVTAKLNALHTGMSAAGVGAITLSDGLKMVQGAFGLLVPLLTIGFVAFNSIKRAQEEARQEALDASKDIVSESTQLQTLTSSFYNAASAIDGTVESKNNLEAASNSLQEALSSERSVVQGLTGDYASLIRTNAQRSAETFEEQANGMISGIQIAEENMVDAITDKNPFGYTSYVSSPMVEVSLLRALKDAGFNAEDMSDIQSGVSITFDVVRTPDDAIEYYEKLIDLRNVLVETLTRQGYEDSGFFDRLEGDITRAEDKVKEYNDLVDAYNKAKVNEAYNRYISRNGLIDTQEEYNDFLAQITQDVMEGETFLGNTEKVQETVNNSIKGISELSEFCVKAEGAASKISVVAQSFRRSVSAANTDDISKLTEEEKAAYTDMIHWYENLGTRDKELVYSLSMSYDTSNWTMDDWLEQLYEAQFHFDELMKEEGEEGEKSFKERVDAYTSDMQDYYNAQAAMDNGTFKPEDWDKLVTDHTELLTAEGETANEKLQSIIDERQSIMKEDFDTQRERLDTAADQQALDEYWAALDAIIRTDSGEVLDTLGEQLGNLYKMQSEYTDNNGKLSEESKRVLQETFGIKPEEGWTDVDWITSVSDKVEETEGKVHDVFEGIKEDVGEENAAGVDIYERTWLNAQQEAARATEAVKSFSDALEDAANASQLLNSAMIFNKTGQGDPLEIIKQMSEMSREMTEPGQTPPSLDDMISIDGGKISFNTGLIQSWKESIITDFAEVTGASETTKNALLGLLMLDDFSTNMSNGFDQLNNLADALTKAQSEGLKGEELAELQIQYPSIAGATDIESAIRQEAINERDAMIGIINEQIASIDPNDIEKRQLYEAMIPVVNQFFTDRMDEAADEALDVIGGNLDKLHEMLQKIKDDGDLGDSEKYDLISTFGLDPSGLNTVDDWTAAIEGLVAESEASSNALFDAAAERIRASGKSEGTIEQEIASLRAVQAAFNNAHDGTDEATTSVTQFSEAIEKAQKATSLLSDIATFNTTGEGDIASIIGEIAEVTETSGQSITDFVNVVDGKLQINSSAINAWRDTFIASLDSIEGMTPQIKQAILDLLDTEAADTYMSGLQENAEKLIEMRGKLVNKEEITPAERKEFSDLFGIDIDMDDIDASIAAIDAKYNEFAGMIRKYYDEEINEAIASGSTLRAKELAEEREQAVAFFNALYNAGIEASSSEQFTNALSDASSAIDLLTTSLDEMAQNGSIGIGTLSDIISRYGAEWANFVNISAEGDITANTDAILKSVYDAIDASTEIDKATKTKLKRNIAHEFSDAVVDTADEYMGTMQDSANKLVEMRNKLLNKEQIAPEEIMEFEDLTGIEIDPNDVDASIAAIEAEFDKFSGKVSEHYDALIKEATDSGNLTLAKDLEEEKQDWISFFEDFFNFSIDTENAQIFTDTLSKLGTAMDALTKVHNEDMSITDVLSTAKQLAEESGQSIENFIETANGKTVLSESGINAWIEEMLQSLKELGASDTTIAQLRGEIDNATAATKDLSSALSDVRDSLQAIADIRVYNLTGNGDQLGMLESIAKMAEGLGGTSAGYSIWDAVSVENGQFKFSEETITSWANTYIEELGLVENATEAERQALLNLLNLEGFSNNMNNGVSKVEELMDALVNIQGETLESSAEIELRLKYPRLTGVENLEEGVLAELNSVRDEMVGLINEQIASLPVGDEKRQWYESMIPMVDALFAEQWKESNDQYMETMQGNVEKLLDMRGKLLEGAEITPQEQKEFSDLFGIQINPDDVEGSVAAIEAQYDKFVDMVRSHYTTLINAEENFDEKARLKEEEDSWLNFFGNLFNYEKDNQKKNTFSDALSDLGTASEILNKLHSGSMSITEVWEAAQQLAEASGKAATDFITTVNGKDALDENAISMWIDETMESLKQLGASDSTLAQLRKEIEEASDASKDLSEAISGVRDALQTLSDVHIFNTTGNGDTLSIVESIAKMSKELTEQDTNGWWPEWWSMDYAISVDEGELKFNEELLENWTRAYIENLFGVQNVAQETIDSIMELLKLENLNKDIDTGISHLDELTGALGKVQSDALLGTESMSESEWLGLGENFKNLAGAEDRTQAVADAIIAERDLITEDIRKRMKDMDENDPMYAMYENLLNGGLDKYIAEKMDEANDSFVDEAKSGAQRLLDMRGKLMDETERKDITPEEVLEFKDLTGIEIDFDNIDATIAEIDAKYNEYAGIIRQGYDLLIDEAIKAGDISRARGLAEEREGVVDFFTKLFNFGIEGETVDSFSDAMSDLGVAIDALSKLNKGNMTIQETWEAAKQLADASGKSAKSFIETVDGKDVLKRSAIDEWVDTIIDDFRKLGASESTLAQLRKEIEETTEVTKSFSDATSDISNGLQVLNDTKIFNRTGNGNPLEMIESLIGLVDSLNEYGGRDYSVWDAVGLNENGDIKFDTDKINEFVVDAIFDFGLVKDASEDMRAALIAALNLEGFSGNMSTGLSALDDLASSLQKVFDETLTGQEEIELRIKYHIPEDADLGAEVINQAKAQRNNMVALIVDEMAKADDAETKQYYASFIPIVNDYYEQQMNSATDAYMSTAEENANKLLDMRSKLIHGETITPEEMKEFGEQFTNIKINPDDVETSVDNIDKGYEGIIDGVRKAFEKRIASAKDHMQEVDLTNEMNAEIAHLREVFNFSEETTETQEFTDALSDLGTAADMLSKVRAGDMSITDTLNAAMQLAEATGDSVESFLTTVDGETVLSEDAIGKWIDNTLNKLKELGASDTLIAQLREEIAETTEVTKELSDAVDDVSTAFQTLSDVRTFNATGVGNQIEILKSLSSIASDLGAETHSIWDIAKVENGQFTFDQSKLEEWTQEYILEMDEIKGASEDAQDAIVSLLSMENAETNVQGGVDKVNELYDAIEQFRNGELSREAQLELEIKYPGLVGADDFVQAAFAEIDLIEQEVLSGISEKMFESAGTEDFATYNNMYNAAKAFFDAAGDATEEAYSDSYKDKGSELTDMYAKLWSDEEISPEDIEAFHVTFPEIEIDSDNLEQSRANIEAAMAGMIEEINAIPESEMSAAEKENLTGYLSRLFNFEIENIKFDNLNNVISNVSSAAELISTANQEIIDSGENSIDTMSSLMDMFGKDWYQYGQFDLSGAFTINTDAIKQKMYDAVDEIDVPGFGEDAKNKLKEQLGFDLDFDIAKEGVEKYTDSLSTLQEALAQIANGEFDANAQYELLQAFPQLATRLGDLDVAIKELINDSYTTAINQLWTAFNSAKTDQSRAEILALIDTIGMMQDKANLDLIIDIDVETTGMEKLTTAIEESNGATGLTAESISAITERYKELDDFDPDDLFDRTASGMRLNQKQAAKLERQLQKQKRDKIDKTLSDLADEYDNLTEQIENTNDEAERMSLERKRDEIVDQIHQVDALAREYDGLVSSFEKWQQAKATPNPGENYDTAVSEFESFQEAGKNGLIGTDEYLAQLEYYTGKDFTFATADEITAAAAEFESKGKRYLTEGSEGMWNFLQDIHEYNDDWAHLNEDGSWDLNFDVDQWAEALGVGPELVQDMIRKLEEYRFNIDWDDPLEEFEYSADTAQSAADRLNETYVDGPKFDPDTTNLESIDEQILGAQELIDNLTKDRDNGIAIDTGDLNAAEYELEYLIQRKTELEHPMLFNINTANLTPEIANAVNLMIKFQTLTTKLKMGIDTGNTIQELKDVSAELDGLDEETKATVGLDTSEFQTAYEEIQEIDVKATVSEETISTIEGAFDGVDPKEIEMSTNDQAILDKLGEIESFVIHGKKFSISIVNSVGILSMLDKIEKYPIHNKTFYINAIQTSSGGSAVPLANGTANASGSAKESGDWGVKKTERALMGELGRRVLRPLYSDI